MTNMQPNFTVEEENEALISFLRADYDDALEQIRVLKSDVNELIDILRKHSIEVPVHIQERIQLDTPLESRHIHQGYLLALVLTDEQWLKYSMSQMLQMAQVFVSKSGSNIGCHVAQIFIDIHTPAAHIRPSGAPDLR